MVDASVEMFYMRLQGCGFLGERLLPRLPENIWWSIYTSDIYARWFRENIRGSQMLRTNSRQR
ncbi:protein of unknown function [Acidithiobacillus ferrivorans]|uniref:Uncharacterized protein n=1 Tax=Acidithiobacillus ferrivorans TaxID=160808 RepID=A0A060UKZ5_9PROT|nr:hypothetical protein AFERRI_150001 [Acidithiobacillus ferrivorans]SMH65674.1 protein of unknown function [Acidithiobacillus ferrivorans]